MRKKTILILAIGSFGLVLAFASLCVLPGWLLSYAMSETRDRVEVASPDGKYIATGYHIFGGATVSDSTIVTIRSKPCWFTQQKDDSVLIVDMRTPGNNPFDLAWSDNTRLTVTYTPGSTFQQISDWKDVHITYVPK